jgi:hypothetical protein
MAGRDGQLKGLMQILIDGGWRELYLVRRRHLDPSGKPSGVVSLDYFQNSRVDGSGNQLVGSFLLNGVTVREQSPAAAAAGEAATAAVAAAAEAWARVSNAEPAAESGAGCIARVETPFGKGTCCSNDPTAVSVVELRCGATGYLQHTCVEFQPEEAAGNSLLESEILNPIQQIRQSSSLAVGSTLNETEGKDNSDINATHTLSRVGSFKGSAKAALLTLMPWGTNKTWEYLRLTAVDGRDLFLRHADNFALNSSESWKNEFMSLSTGELAGKGIGKGEWLEFEGGGWGTADAKTALNYGGELQLQQIDSSDWKGDWS